MDLTDEGAIAPARPVSLRRLTLRVSAVIGVLLAVVLYPTWRPSPPTAGLDPSWAAVIIHAFSEDWQFGKDIIFTHGPLGFIGLPSFVPGLYPVTLSYWIFFAALMASAIFLLNRERSVLASLLALAAIAVCALTWVHDGRVFAACFVLFLTGRRFDRPSTVITLLLVISLAIAGLMKLTYLAAALPAVGVLDFTRYTLRRAPPIMTPLFLAVFVAAYGGAGQDIGNLGSYLTGAFEISRGYNDAMGTTGDASDIAAFAAVALAGSIAIAWHELRRDAPQRPIIAAATVLVFGALTFIAGKAGFVRYDTGHRLIAWTAIVLGLAAYLGTLDLDRRSRGPRILLGVAIVAALICVSRNTVPGAPGAAQALTSLVRENGASMYRLALDGQYRRQVRAYPEFLKRIRDQNPLPQQVSGPTDTLGGDPATLLAHGADYRPRPIFQSYAVYTPALIARNIAFLESDRAPETILFKVTTIDGRWPALDEGALWPDLFRFYDAVEFQNDMAVLKRRRTPRKVTLDLLLETDLAFGEALDLSAYNDEMLWAEIRFQPTLFGKLRGVLAKPPIAGIRTVLEGGREADYRVVPGMTEAGFLLSPLVEHTDAFVALPKITAPRVMRFSIEPADLGSGFYHDRAHVRLMRLRIGDKAESRAP